MLKKTIQYVDYDGNSREGVFYFNLSKAEVLEMEVEKKGGLSEQLKVMVKAQEPGELMAAFKEIVLRSYGIKEPGGNRFMKSKEISEAFCQTEAYSELVIQLCTDAEACAEFVNGIMPKVPNPPPSSN